MRTPPRYLTDRERAQIHQLHAAGFSAYRIGKFLGRRQQVVRRVVLGTDRPAEARKREAANETALPGWNPVGSEKGATAGVSAIAT